MTILLLKKIACPTAPELPAERLIGRRVFECQGAGRLLGSVHEVVDAVPRGDAAGMVDRAVAAGMSRGLAATLVGFGLKRDDGPYLLVTRRLVGPDDEAEAPRITNLRDVGVVCDTMEEVGRVRAVQAAYRAEAGATVPGSSRYVLEHRSEQALRDRCHAMIAAMAESGDFFPSERARLAEIVRRVGGSRETIRARAAERAAARGYDAERAALLAELSVCLADVEIGPRLPVTAPMLEADPHTGQPFVEWYGIDWNWLAAGQHVAWVKRAPPVRALGGFGGDQDRERFSYEPERPSVGPDQRFVNAAAAVLSMSSVDLLGADLFALHADPAVLAARREVAEARAAARQCRPPRVDATENEGEFLRKMRSGAAPLPRPAPVPSFG